MPTVPWLKKIKIIYFNDGLFLCVGPWRCTVVILQRFLFQGIVDKRTGDIWSFPVKGVNTGFKPSTAISMDVNLKLSLYLCVNLKLSVLYEIGFIFFSGEILWWVHVSILRYLFPL